MAAKKLHPVMQANADKLKRGEALNPKKAKTPTPQRPKIKSKQKKG